MIDAPLLTALAVHWHNESDLQRLCQAWPDDPRFELIIINNGSEAALPRDCGEVLEPPHNLGFAGAINYGLKRAKSPLILILNSDIAPQPGALDQLLRGFQTHPRAAGLAPRLISADGTPQYSWQLSQLPRLPSLLLQALLLPVPKGRSAEPSSGDAVEQPAAAALAMRRDALTELAGLDESFFPAWFEDVDLARRAKAANLTLRYWPAALFHHKLGSSVPRLGYGNFLWIYYRNLCRYLAKHYGVTWSRAAQLALPIGCFLRVLLLPIRCPRRATSRAEAAVALSDLACGALSGWRYPARRATLTRVPSHA